MDTHFCYLQDAKNELFTFDKKIKGYHIREAQTEDLIIATTWPKTKIEMEDWILNDLPFNPNPHQTQMYFNDMSHSYERLPIAFVDTDNNILGYCELNFSRHHHGALTLSNLIICDQHRNIGLATIFVQLIKNFVFDLLNFNRLELLIVDRNNIAKKMFYKSNFVTEATHESAIYLNTDFHDMIRMRIIKPYGHCIAELARKVLLEDIGEINET